MPRKRTGSVFWHVDHFDMQVTLPNGKRSKRACLPVGVSEADARAEAARMTRIVATHGGELVDDPDEDGETVEAWGERWWEVRRSRGIQVEAESPRWQKWILSAPARGKLRFGELPIASVTRDDVEDVVQHLDEQVRAGALAWKTAANAWGLLSKAFSDARDDKTRRLRVRQDNPARDVRPPDRGQRKTKAWLHPAELLAVLSNPDESLTVRRALALNVYLYLRPGELRALRWCDVDLALGCVSVHRAIRRDGTEKGTKTETPRTIPIEPTLLPLLGAMREAAGPAAEDEAVIELPADTALADVLRAALRRAGVTRAELYATSKTRKQVTWYDLRATGITWRAIRGDNPIAIMEHAGHASFQTTQGYIRTASAMRSKLTDVFPALPAELYESTSRESLRESLQIAQPREMIVGRQGLEPCSNPQKQADFGPFRAESLRESLHVDPLEKALVLAAEAGRFDVVAKLADELHARRVAAAGNVVAIDPKRGRQR